MRKFLVSIGGLMIVLMAVACQNENRTQSSELEGTVYRGLIPCADCPGISLRISLKKDGRYQTARMYINESSRKFIEQGRWSVKDDSILVLSGEDDTGQTFVVHPNQIVMLNRDGSKVTGSLAQNYILHKVDATENKHSWPEKRQQGIDFCAAGNEPFWGLDIDFDEMMIFRSLNGDTIKTPVPDMKQDAQSKARLLRAEVESGSLVVALFPIGCVDSMSGWVYDYVVEVEINGEQFSGCGSFINPIYKLNDFWTLHRLDGEEVTKEERTQELPSLQFDVSEEKIYGYTGCNQLSGAISLQDSSLTFSKLITTKMACMDDNLEQPFLNALQIANTFDISNDTLILLQNSDTLMVLRRAE